MGKKSWLRNLIFEDVEQNTNTNNQKEEKQSLKPVSETSPKPGPAPVVGMPKIEKPIDPDTVIGKVDKTLLTKLCRVLDEQPEDGIDYVKFKKAVDSLKSIQPEEDIRFTSTYLTLKVTHPALSKEHLLKTIDKYIGLMEQERKVGMEQLKKLRSNDIDKKTGEIETARKNVEKMKAEILRLTQFITEAEMNIVTKQNEIAVKEADFNATVENIINQLKSDRVKIETIIK